MDWDAQVVPSIVEDHLVQLTPVAAKVRGLGIVRHRGLVVHNLARVPFVNVEAVARGVGVNAQWAELVRDGAVAPAGKDASSIRAKGDDVAQSLELGKSLVHLDIVALTPALYSRSEPTKTCDGCQCLSRRLDW